jgi:transposase
VERPSEALARDERRRRAEEMREKGMSYRAIGSLLGVDGETIRRDLTLADQGAM